MPRSFLSPPFSYHLSLATSITCCCTRRYSAEVRQREAAQIRLRQAGKELEQARHAIAVSSSQEVELKRQMEEKVAQEREKRIEHTAQMAARRFIKHDLTRGWASWYYPYAQRARVRMVLRGAAARLLKPKLVGAVQHWRRDWEVARLNHQLREIAAQLEAARAQGMSDTAMKEEMQRQLEEQMARERLKRIEHQTQTAVHRIGKRDLTRGWLTWSDSYLRQARMQRMLRGVGARLLKPKLVGAVQHWKDDWKATQ